MINFTPSFSQFSRKLKSHAGKLPVFFLSCLLITLISLPLSGQFLHRNGKQIVDGDGKPVILRGMGLGGWMLQEGYMLEMNSFANPQHQIRARIEELLGTANTDKFYEAWYANHCTKTDIDSLKAWGFNSVRLPMHFNLFTLPVEKEPVTGQHTWLEKGFAMTDSLLKWCAANSMYVILDLHAAPGGQGRDAAISDYDSSKPSLWESEANRKKTVALWKKLAERYANEKWIGGYDLINETNWNFTAGKNQNGCEETTNSPLRQLYVEITAAIREVDPNHLIFIEGNCWANNHAGLFPGWDNNMAISFHKYWSYNDAGSIQGMINLRNQHNLPLWMGEAGENSNTWFTNAIELLEKNEIGWAWWPMKKVGSVVCPLTVTRNDEYNTLLNYWKNGGTKPDVQFATDAMMQLAEDLKIQNTTYHKDVIDAMFRQVGNTNTISYKKQMIPGVVHLSDFDLGRHGKAYSDKDTATHHVSGGSYTAWNNGWTYRNDGVDLEKSIDQNASSNGHHVGWTADGEWLQYTVTVDSSAAYTATLRYAASATGSMVKLSIDGIDKTAPIELTPTGGNQVWTDKSIHDVLLVKGTNRIRFQFVKGGANVAYINFQLSKKQDEVAFRAISGATSTDDGTRITLTLNKKIKTPATVSLSDFDVNINTAKKVVSEVIAGTENPHQITLRIDGEVLDTDVITVSYNGSTITATDETLLEAFTNLAIENNLPFHIIIPSKIEAENFVKNVGLQLENTSDAGGGQNIGYTSAGDYLEYRVRVTEAREYLVELRVASAGSAGVLEIQQENSAGVVVNSVHIDIPVTGGWQTWQTVNAKITLDAIRGILRLKVIRPEFNLNWMRFSPLIINDVKENRQGSIQLYPNPVDTLLKLEFREDPAGESGDLRIRNLAGQIVKQVRNIFFGDLPTLYVGDLVAGLYFLEISTRNHQFTERFMKI